MNPTFDLHIQVKVDVLHKFEEARANILPVHDKNLKKWALQCAKKIGLDLAKFKASHWWLSKLKRKYKISSRKVTKLLTKHQAENSEALDKAAEDFRAAVLEESVNYPPDLIFNSDQSGFTYELHSSRTLSKTGEKVTFLKIRSHNKCTHSYTIMPILDYNGKLRGKLYICLQEPKGRMGPQVEPTYFRAQNVEVTCSTSGNLTTSLFTRWVERVLYPEVWDDCLVLLDSWGGQQNDISFNCFSGDKSCTRMKIPAGTTSKDQPLDVFYFHHWKAVVKYFHDWVMLHDIDINLSERDNIIKLQSLIHNQFSSDHFQAMGQLAWFEAKLNPFRPDPFESATEILFPKTFATGCSEEHCSETAFIQCSYCHRNLCFLHFFGDNDNEKCNDKNKDTIKYHVHFD